MIAKLTGSIDELRPTDLILDVGGVGYELTIPVSTYEKIQGKVKVSLFVHTLHKEDQFRLFGFISSGEKELFRALIGVNGIGPAMAISVLSGLSPDRLLDAVRNDNTGILTKVPGIGKSKAEKLIFELKRKISRLEEIAGPAAAGHSHSRDAIEALIALGFDDKRASKCISEIGAEGSELETEELIKEALKILV